MKRSLLASFAALLGLLAAYSPVSAQFTYPFQAGQRYPGWQTPLSPYLNLLRPGNPAVNYYGLVEPEFQRRQDRGVIYNSLQSLANQLPQRPGIMEEEFNAPLRSTGHPTAFGYTGSYFGGGVSTAVRGPISNPFPQRQAGPQSQFRQPLTKPQPPGK
jgi:hypothetical protein